MTVTIKGASFRDMFEVKVNTKKGDVVKVVPKGWALVKPDERLDSDCLIAYVDCVTASLISQISRTPVGYWDRSRLGCLIETGDIYHDVVREIDLWRLIRPDATSTRASARRPDPNLERFKEGNQVAMLMLPTVLTLTDGTKKRFDRGTIIGVNRDKCTLSITKIWAPDIKTFAKGINDGAHKALLGCERLEIQPLEALPFSWNDRPSPDRRLLVKYATGYAELVPIGK